MKFQSLASIALAALSATVSSAPVKPEENGSCPAGYSPSVSYITVTAEATPVVEAASLTTATPVSTSLSTSVSTTTTTTVSTTSNPESTSTLTTSTTAVEYSTVGSIESIPADFVKQPTTSTTSSTEETSTISNVEASTANTNVAVAQPTTTTTSTASASTNTETSAAKSAQTSGTATFYGGNLSGGTCSFSDYTIPSGLYGVAFSGQAWDSAAECGACVSVTGPDGNSVKAMIVDQCPECEASHLDLFEDAFTTLASKSAGEIAISFSFEPCSITSPLILKNKSGTSAYWFSMQVVNANEAVKSLEVSTDGGETWQETTRSEYNFFENDAGFGVDSVNVRVTGVSGKSVVVEGVGCESGSSKTAGGNL